MIRFLRRRFFLLKAHTDSVVKVGVEREKNVYVCHILETGWRSVKVPVALSYCMGLLHVSVYFPYLTRAVQVAPTFFTQENHNQNVRIRMVASQKFVYSAGSPGVALSSSEISSLSVPCFASICLVLNPRATEPSGPVATRD